MSIEILGRSRIELPGRASLLAILLMTTLAAGVAHAVDAFGGGTQHFSCDVNSRICKCEGDRKGADCQAMGENCKDGGLIIFECDMNGSNCRCCMGGGKDCFGGSSPNTQEFRILDGQILEGPGRDLKAVDPRNPSGAGATGVVRPGILEGPRPTAILGQGTPSPTLGATVVGNTATAQPGWRFRDNRDGSATAVPTLAQSTGAGGSWACVCDNTCRTDSSGKVPKDCQTCSAIISEDKLRCDASSACPAGSTCRLVATINGGGSSVFGVGRPAPGASLGQVDRKGAVTGGVGGARPAPSPPAPAAPRLVLIPKVDGKRLDWCLNWGRNCGEPAASAYCRSNGYSRAERWQQDPDVGNTWVLGDRKACKDKGCDGFKSIACVKDAAGAPTTLPRVVNPD